MSRQLGARSKAALSWMPSVGTIDGEAGPVVKILTGNDHLDQGKATPQYETDQVGQSILGSRSALDGMMKGQIIQPDCHASP